MRCPCGSGLTFDECCGPIHRGSAIAPTAERLMRSRFSAFAVGDAEWLLESWHPSTRPSSLELDAGTCWFRLDILSRSRGGMLDSEGTVEFDAHYRSPDGHGIVHELSAFARENGRWLYVSAL